MALLPLRRKILNKYKDSKVEPPAAHSEGLLQITNLNYSAMRIDIITVVPQLLDSPFAHSIMKRAQQKGLLEVHAHDLRQYTTYAHAQVDDYQFGGGAGMVMMPEPLVRAIETLQNERTYDEIIYMTPDGERFEQKIANRLSMKGNLM